MVEPVGGQLLDHSSSHLVVPSHERPKQTGKGGCLQTLRQEPTLSAALTAPKALTLVALPGEFCFWNYRRHFNGGRKVCVLSGFDGSRQSALSYRCKPRGDRLKGLSSHLRAINTQSFFLSRILHPLKIVLACFRSRLHSKPWEAEFCLHSLHGACCCPPSARRFISHIPVIG